MKSDELLIIGIPTRSGNWEIDASQLLVDASLHLAKLGAKRGRLIMWSNKHGIDRARNQILAKLRDYLEDNNIEHNGSVRMLWYDTDVIPMSQPDQLAEMIRAADEHGWNLLGHYWAWDDQKNTAYSTFNRAFTNGQGERRYNLWSPDELKQLRPYMELPDTVGGLGFYYGDQPLGWQFRLTEESGEDTGFFLGTNLPLRWFPINLQHRKTMLI